MAQVLIDENAFTQFFNVFTASDNLISIRKLIMENIKTRRAFAKELKKHMTTSLISKILPTFTEEFGKKRNLDIMFTPSHNRFLNAFPEAKRSSVYIDKNGNWKI